MSTIKYWLLLTLASATSASSGTSFSPTTGSCSYRSVSNLTEVIVGEVPQPHRNSKVVNLCSASTTISMLDLDRHPLPDQLGYLVLSEDGSVHASGGELENDERSANIISNLLTLTESVDPAVFNARACRKVSIVFNDHSYTICLSNKRIYVVKRRNRVEGNAAGGLESDGHSILA